MAIVRYHSVGASNTGKVRPAPYKYANPTDLTIAPYVPLQVTSGRFDDFFFGTGGDRGKRDEFGRTRKSRREHFDKLADYYNRCSENGARFDPSFVDDLPIFTIDGDNRGDSKAEATTSLVYYNFSSSQYADKSAVWCKKPYWMFETIAHDSKLPPEGWFDFRFENTQDPEYGVDPKEGVDGAEANLKQIRKDVLKENGLKANFNNPEQVYERIESLRGELSDEKVNDLLLDASVHPRFDLAYAEFAKFLLPQTGIEKYMEEYGNKSLSEIYLPTFEEYKQQLIDYVGEARTPDGPQKVACFLDYDIAGATYPPIDTSFLKSKKQGDSTVFETKNFDNKKKFNKLASIELGPNLWPPRDDVHADPGDKWPARGINEERFQFKMVAADAAQPVVTEMVWEPLNPNFKKFEEGLKQEIGFGIALDLVANKIKKSEFYEDYLSDHRDTMPVDPDSLDQKKVKKALDLPILGKSIGKDKVKVPAMSYQMDAIAFDTALLENISKEQSIGVNKGSSFDKGINFTFTGPDVFGVPTKKPWKDRVDAMAKELGFVWDDTDGQTWNDVTFMSGVPYVEFNDISPELAITVDDVNELVAEATNTTSDGTTTTDSKFSYIEGSKKNESKEAGIDRLNFAARVLSEDDTLISYINYGQKDSMDAGDPPGGHDGRGDKTTFNGYGLLNGFGGNDNIYSLFASNLSYGGDGDDQLTGLDKFYDRLFGERGDDIMISMGQDVMDGGSGNDHYFVGIEPRLLVSTPNMDASNLVTLGTETNPAEEMSNFVAIENFDIPGLTHDHKDLVARDKEDKETVESLKDIDFVDNIYIDKDHLLARYGIQLNNLEGTNYNYKNPADRDAIERHFYSAPRMGFTLATKDYLDKGSESTLNLTTDQTFQSARSAYPASFYLWLGKEDFKGRNNGADPITERYLSLDLTWGFGETNGQPDARTFRDSESIARFSDLRPKELSDINEMWDEYWDDIYSQFGKTNPMHRKLMAQTIAELNPDYEPFKPYLDELYDNVYPRWKGDGCDVVNWDKDYDESWEQPNRYQVIRKYNPGRTPVLPVEGNGGLNLENLEPLVDKFAWDLWDTRREEVMDRIKLVESPIPVISEIVGF